MMRKHHRLLATLVCAIAFASVLALAGCGGSDNSGTDATPTEEPGTEATADTTATDTSATENTGDSNAEPLASSPAYDETDCMLIALGDAGVAVDGCMITDEGVHQENGKTIYSIEFYTDDLEYEYAIDMDTGQIFAADSEPR